jgi:hypothetical protein
VLHEDEARLTALGSTVQFLEVFVSVYGAPRKNELTNNLVYQRPVGLIGGLKNSVPVDLLVLPGIPDKLVGDFAKQPIDMIHCCSQNLGDVANVTYPQ